MPRGSLPGLVVAGLFGAAAVLGGCAGEDPVVRTADVAGSNRPIVSRSETAATTPDTTTPDTTGKAAVVGTPATAIAGTGSGSAPPSSLIDVSGVGTCAELAEMIVPLFDGLEVDSLAEAVRDDELIARLTATIGQLRARQTALGCDVAAVNAGACQALEITKSPLAQEFLASSC